MSARAAPSLARPSKQSRRAPRSKQPAIKYNKGVADVEEVPNLEGEDDDLLDHARGSCRSYYCRGVFCAGVALVTLSLLRPWQHFHPLRSSAAPPSAILMTAGQPPSIPAPSTPASPTQPAHAHRSPSPRQLPPPSPCPLPPRPSPSPHSTPPPSLLSPSPSTPAPAPSAPKSPAPMTSSDRLQSILPLVWVHVPKTGTSFGNLLYHHPQICPYFPSEAIIGRPGIENEDEFLERYHRDELCPGSFSHAYLTPAPHHQHDAFGDAYPLTVGHAFIMLREPSQRILSHWYDSTWEFDEPAALYARRTAGLTVRMLIRKEATLFERCCSQEEVDLALQRLSTFAFVGITSRWSLTVCLFHAMFGGDAKSSDFFNSRPGDHSSSKAHGLYDESLLDGYVDTADTALYELGLKIFERNLEQYGVSEETCA